MGDTPSQCYVVSSDARFCEGGEFNGFANCHFRRFETLKAAGVALAESRPILIVLDSELADGDGYAFHRQLRSRAETSDIAIILRCPEEHALRDDCVADDILLLTIRPEIAARRIRLFLQSLGYLDAVRQELGFTRRLTHTVMSSMGELGVVMQFLSRSFACEDIPSVANLALEALDQYSIPGLIHIHWADKSHTAGTPEFPDQDSHLRTLRARLQSGRIQEGEDHLIINFDHVSLLIIPSLEDPERWGRIRDHLATLVEGVESRVHRLLLEDAILRKDRTNRELRQIKEQLEQEIAERVRAHTALAEEREEQKILIKKLADANTQLVQSEKLASIGQLAAGVAHEINNPIGFVMSNLGTLKSYAGDLMELVDIYRSADEHIPADSPHKKQLKTNPTLAELDFLREDIGDLIAESIDGTTRVRKIVQDLRDFSRMGDVEWQMADLHEGLESTLNIVANEIKYKAEVVRAYGKLPQVECIMSQLNQVFMNLLVNAAHAIEGRGTITIRTNVENDHAWIAITDTGKGIPPEILPRIFDPFFTTKPVGKGTGLGLSVSYGIVEKHQGRIEVSSVAGGGSTFTVRIPLTRANP